MSRRRGQSSEKADFPCSSRNKQAHSPGHPEMSTDMAKHIGKHGKAQERVNECMDTNTPLLHGHTLPNF